MGKSIENVRVFEYNVIFLGYFGFVLRKYYIFGGKKKCAIEVYPEEKMCLKG